MHDFEERLNYSQGIALEKDIREVVARLVPGFTGLRKATVSEDKQGIDYLGLRGNRPPISFDVKHREVCPIKAWNSDDACIECWSVWKGNQHPDNKPGWTYDPNKLCDYIIYTWPATGGRRYWIVPFHALHVAAKDNWHKWTKSGFRDARNNGYLTRCVYPQRAVIKAAIEAVLEGIRDWQAEYTEAEACQK